MLKLAHIINPVIVRETSDLYIAQPITFETMRRAQAYAAPCVDVRLFSAQYSEDRSLVPDFVQKTPDLEHSVLDFGNFVRNRKLPLLRDILDRLYDAAADADFLIYSNVDIALLPHFYEGVVYFIQSGYDGFTINRRTISKHFRDIAEIPHMYAEVGEKHPGSDCFVFPRKRYPNYKLGDACIGAEWIGRILVANMITYARKFSTFTDYHLTFHIGDDRVWVNKPLNDYRNFNREEFAKLLRQLLKESDLSDQAIARLHGYAALIERDREMQAGVHQKQASMPLHKQLIFLTQRIIKAPLRIIKHIVCGK